jgi:thioesterase domain-containing protein
MAATRHLEDAGERVAFLGLIEAEIGGIDEDDSQIVQRRIVEMVEVMQGMLPGVELVSEEILEETVAAFADSLLDTSAEERMALVESWLQEQEIVSGDESKSLVRDVIAVFFAHWRITKGFAPSAVRAPVHVWRAKDGNAPSIAQGAWKACFPNLVVEGMVPGSHFGVMKPPQVDTLAERVAEAMGEMQMQGTPA